jgi:hypothetical protein
MTMGDHGFALFILFLGALRLRRSLGANVKLHFRTFFSLKTHFYVFANVMKNVLYMYLHIIKYESQNIFKKGEKKVCQNIEGIANGRKRRVEKSKS